MPGLVGIITSKPRSWAEPLLMEMVDAQRHEPFYKTGTWVDESMGVYIGWTALPGSFSASMPVVNEKGGVALIFSGEEYPEPSTIYRLKQRGHSVEPDGPSYLVHLYEDDPKFPAGLNGVFHGVLVDRTRGTTTLFNDRYGMHRVHYHRTADTFYFAAEAKAILSVRPDLRTADPKGLGEFVAFNCVLENRTIFKDIYVLPFASTWTFRAGALASKSTYFCAREWEGQAQLEPQSYYEELRSVLTQNLSRYFEGPQQKGIALTGGYDTRVIMAFSNPKPNSVSTYTFGGTMRESRDVKIAAQVARECNQQYQVIPVGGEFLSRFPQYAERAMFISEGGIDVSHASDLYVSTKARTIAPIKIVGTYGSEIFGRLVMFKPAPTMPSLFDNGLASYIQGAADTYKQFTREHPLTFAAFRQFPWYHHGILALEQSQLTVRSPFLDNDFVRTAYLAPNPAAASADVRPRLIADACLQLARIPSDRGVRASGTLASAICRGLLDLSYKAEYAYDYGMPQWLASVNNALSWLQLQRIFLGRHKFLHFRTWYREQLSEYVRQMLLDPATLSRPFVNRKTIEYVVKMHTSGSRNFTTEIHKLLSLELLHRLFFEPKSS